MNYMYPYIFQNKTNYNLYKFIILSTILSITLAACVTPNTTTNTLGLTQAKPIQYEAAGRIAMKMGRDSGQVSFDWVEKNNASKISITGPLGQGNFTAMIKPDFIEATIDGKYHTSSDPDLLFEELTKVSWPVSATKFWLRGQAKNPQTADISRNEQHITKIIENGWIISYPEWQTTNQGLLPKLIIIQQETPQNTPNSNTQAKILVNRWKL